MLGFVTAERLNKRPIVGERHALTLPFRREVSRERRSRRAKRSGGVAKVAITALTSFQSRVKGEKRRHIFEEAKWAITDK